MFGDEFSVLYRPIWDGIELAYDAMSSNKFEEAWNKYNEVEKGYNELKKKEKECTLGQLKIMSDIKAKIGRLEKNIANEERNPKKIRKTRVKKDSVVNDDRRRQSKIDNGTLLV